CSLNPGGWNGAGTVGGGSVATRRQGETGTSTRQAFVLAAFPVVLHGRSTGNDPSPRPGPPDPPGTVLSGRHYRPVPTACQRHFAGLPGPMPRSHRPAPTTHGTRRKPEPSGDRRGRDGGLPA